MEDDLDDLLDEVETKFCRNVSLTPQGPSDISKNVKCLMQTGKERQYCPTEDNLTHRKHDSEDIDALLEDIPAGEFDSFELNFPKTEKALPQSTKRKCCPVFLGGSSIQNGLGTAVSERSCDQLRCISCDFRVATFDDHEWDPSCDYLFFRNNVPDGQKLRVKLRRRSGLRAYCCQCSWHTAPHLIHLGQQPHLKWVCGKHDV